MPADLHLTAVPDLALTRLAFLRTYLSFDDLDVVVNALHVYEALVKARRDGNKPQLRRPNGTVEDFILL